jgi:hypothetical protein
VAAIRDARKRVTALDPSILHFVRSQISSPGLRFAGYPDVRKTDAFLARDAALARIPVLL